MPGLPCDKWKGFFFAVEQLQFLHQITLSIALPFACQRDPGFFYFPPQQPYPKHLQCFSLHLVHGNNISSSKKLFGLAVQDTEGWSEQSGYPFVTLSPTFRRQSSWLKKWWFTRDKRLSFRYKKYHLAVLWKGCRVNNPTSIIFFKRHGWLWSWLTFVL